MNSSLIAVLAAVAVLILIVVLKRSSGKKRSPAAPLQGEKPPSAHEDLTTAEQEEVSGAGEPVAEVEEELAAASSLEPEVEADQKVAEETASRPASRPEPEGIAPPVADTEPEPLSAPGESILEEAGQKEGVSGEPLVAAISLESYEQRLLALKEQRLVALTAAIEKNEETKREQLQIELVALTEALSFLKQGYEQEISCRNNALAALELMRPQLAADDYERASGGVREGDTEEAEQVFDSVAEQDSSLAAMAAYQSGCLAACRIDFSRAMDRFDKAVALDDGNSPDHLRSAALLARQLYRHKKALAWFAALVQLLEEQGEDSVELALARRELAYTSALVGRHKQAGELYKKAMVSLTALRGREDQEMGICWYQIGKLQEALGQYEKAEDPYKKALAILGNAPDNAVFGDILNKLAGLYMELEREREAIPLFERLCAFKREAANPDNASLAMAYNNLAEACRICGRYDESEKNYKHSLAITEELRGKDHAAVASILQELAQLCQRQGKKDEAQEHQERAAAIFQRVLEEQEAANKQSASLTLSD